MYIKKNSNTQEKFQKLKEKYFRPLIYMTDTEDGREIFPIGWAGTCSVKELELKVLRMLRTHPETKECFVHCVNEQQGLSLLREMTRYSV